MNTLTKICTALSLALFSIHALADEFCVDTSETFSEALLASSTNNVDDTILLAEGTFTPPNDGGFVAVITDGHALTISGGFGVNLLGTCVPASSNAYRTIVAGSPSRVLLSISPSSPSSAPIILRGLAFTGAHGAALDESPVEISGKNGWQGDVLIENVAIRYNEAQRDVLLVSTHGRVLIRNSEIVGNRSSQAGPGNVVSVYAGTPSTLGTYLFFNNNTVAENVVDQNGYVLELYVGGGDLRMANNIIWNPGGRDLRVDDYFHMYHNDIRQYFGTSPAEIVAPLSVAPVFLVFDNEDSYRLAASSPLRNAGMTTLPVAVPAVAVPGGVGSMDVEGVTRVLEGAVDIGAHEFDVLFADSFD